MKVFQIIFSLSSGGAERVVTNLSNELAKNHELYIITIHKNVGNNSFYLNQLDQKINVISLNKNRGISLDSFVKIFNLIKKHKPNIVHAHLNTILYCILPSLIFKKIKFFHTLHSIADKTIKIKWQKAISKFYYKNKIIHPIAISKECAISYQKFYGLRDIAVIENGVPIPEKSDKFVEVKKEIEGYRLSKGIIFVHIARFSKEKNQELLVAIFNELIAQGNNIKLLIIGNGFDSDEGMLLKQKAKKGIYFLGEKRNPTDYLLCSDCFILSSMWEGLPMSLLEAMSCGLPTVSTPAGGIADILVKDYLGVLSKDFSSEELKKAVASFIDSQSVFESSKIKLHFENIFSIQKATNSHVKLYTGEYDNIN